MDDTPKKQSEIEHGVPGDYHPHLNSVDILGGKRFAQGPDKVNLPPDLKEPPIGVALIKDKETIVLHLIGKSGGTTGEAEVEYHRGDLYYDDVFKHIGGIKKGESKDVAPWPDDIKSGTKPERQEVTPPGQNKESPKEQPKDQPKDSGKDQPKDPGKDQPKDPGKDQPKDPGKDQAPDPLGQPTDQTGKPAPDVIIPPSVTFSTLVTDTFGKMSLEAREVLSDAHTAVTPTHRLTDALPELKGQKPRGWPPGLTWDAVDGAYSPARNMVVVAEETQGASGNWVKSNRTADVTRHEVGHATDYGMGKLSSTTEFIKAYEDDTQHMPPALAPTLKYFLQSGDGGKEEACAESIAAREGGATSGKAFDLGFAKSIAAVNDALLKRKAALGSGIPAGGNAGPNGNPPEKQAPAGNQVPPSRPAPRRHNHAL